MTEDIKPSGETVLASRAPGRSPAEFAAIQHQRAAALSSRGDISGAAATLRRAQTPGEYSTAARTDAIRARRIAESSG